jgi:hypothetical protein
MMNHDVKTGFWRTVRPDRFIAWRSPAITTDDLPPEVPA